MYPILFQIGGLNIYSYGFMIMTGAILGYFYAVREGKKTGISSDKIAEMAVYILIASYLGGKVFLWAANWEYYSANPQKMIIPSGSGFVFYGSLLFSLAVLMWFFRRNKMKPAYMFDILAVSGTLVHGFGKIGCFLAGCCHGTICDGAYGVIYTHEKSAADPLHQPLYPTQLMDAVIVFGCTILLLIIRPKKQFDGQLMLLYLVIYGTGRFFTEFLRGDTDRGAFGPFSHSQWVSLILVPVCLWFYVRLKRKAETLKS